MKRSVALGHDDAAGRLGRRMLDRRGLVALLEDVVGRGEALVDVAEADAPAMVAFVDEVVLAVILVDERRARLQRLLDVEDGRQDLVVDLHPRGAFARRRGAVGEHGDDRLALAAHLVGASTGSSSGPTWIRLRIV